MKDIILFGAGVLGREILKYIGTDRVVCFCDNYCLDNTIDGVDVINFDELKLIFKENYEIVVTISGFKSAVSVIRQLNEYRLPYTMFYELIDRIIDQESELYKDLNRRHSFDIYKENLYYCENDRFEKADDITPYFWQDLWAAKHIYKNKPDVHYDIGSRVDGFISNLITYGQKVVLIDVRPLDAVMPDVSFVQEDATHLTSIRDDSICSISALCSLEHFGLGRYGDQIDPEACFSCFSAIQDKVKSGGRIYIAVPVGREHLEFNAHRIFFAKTIVDAFHRCDLVEYSTAHGNTIEYNSNIHKYDELSGKGCQVFGLFYFVKR